MYISGLFADLLASLALIIIDLVQLMFDSFLPIHLLYFIWSIRLSVFVKDLQLAHLWTDFQSCFFAFQGQEEESQARGGEKEEGRGEESQAPEVGVGNVHLS